MEAAKDAEQERQAREQLRRDQDLAALAALVAATTTELMLPTGEDACGESLCST
jgi:hypothetical protein